MARNAQAVHRIACGFLTACAMLVGDARASAQPADAAGLAAYQGADRERVLLEGAKREGELTLYSSMQVDSITPLQKAFEAKYGVKVRIWRGSGKDILQRVLTEAAGNRFDVDIAESDSFALEALHREGLLQPVESPYFADLVPQALRQHRQWVGTRLNIVAAVYNTRLVKPESVPKSYEDLRDPRFRGMLGIEADDYDWFGMVVGLMGDEKGCGSFAISLRPTASRYARATRSSPIWWRPARCRSGLRSSCRTPTWRAGTAPASIGSCCRRRWRGRTRWAWPSVPRIPRRRSCSMISC